MKGNRMTITPENFTQERIKYLFDKIQKQMLEDGTIPAHIHINISEDIKGALVALFLENGWTVVFEKDRFGEDLDSYIHIYPNPLI